MGDGGAQKGGGWAEVRGDGRWESEAYVGWGRRREGGRQEGGGGIPRIVNIPTSLSDASGFPLFRFYPSGNASGISTSNNFYTCLFSPNDDDSNNNDYDDDYKNVGQEEKLVWIQ